MRVLPSDAPAPLPATALAKPVYIPGLDVVRALAILAVMCHHWLPADWLVNRVQDETANGVHLFFVLSGFLITQILLRARDGVGRGSSTLGRTLYAFYGRRFLRIFPAYYLVLLLGVALGFPSVREAVGWHASYLSNVYYYRARRFDGPASVFWTLSVEEQFYLAWPALVLLVPRRHLGKTLVATVAVGVVARTGGHLGDGWLNILTPACLMFLGGGGLLAYANRSDRLADPVVRRRLRVAAAACGLVVLAGLVAAHRPSAHGAALARWVKVVNQPLMTYLFCFAVYEIVRCPGAARPAGRAARPLVFVGRISYGLYLYHLFVSDLLGRLTVPGVPLTTSDGPGAGRVWLVFSARFAVTVAVAAASWYAFERPINDLKRRLPY